MGINNDSPKATLDITAKTTDGSKPEGLLAPRLTGDQIQAGNAMYTAAQKGIIVYATSAPASPSGKTANIMAEGYYFFDGSVWQKITGNNSVSYTTIVDANILGYTPSTTATASVDAPTTLAIGGITATRRGVGSFGGHSYASYSTNAAVTWY